MSKEIKFEDKIANLEQIINDLENGNVDLNDSIKKYTEAMTLVKECDKELKSMEEKVTKIVHEDGTLEDMNKE